MRGRGPRVRGPDAGSPAGRNGPSGRSRSSGPREPSGPGEPSGARQVSAWNIANALTVFRLVLVPVFVWLLLHDHGEQARYRLLAAGVFVLATLTDRIDGDIARAKGLVTDFGKVSDPIADKALMGAAFIGLSILSLVPWWMTVLILLRELGITVLRFFVIRHGVIPASRGGKLKTALQALAALLYVLPLYGGSRVAALVVLLLAVVVTVATGVDYILRARRLRRTSPRAQAKRARRAAAAAAAAAHTAAQTGTDAGGPSGGSGPGGGSGGTGT